MYCKYQIQVRSHSSRTASYLRLQVGETSCGRENPTIGESVQGGNPYHRGMSAGEKPLPSGNLCRRETSIIEEYLQAIKLYHRGISAGGKPLPSENLCRLETPTVGEICGRWGARPGQQSSVRAAEITRGTGCRQPQTEVTRRAPLDGVNCSSLIRRRAVGSAGQ